MAEVVFQAFHENLVIPFVSFKERDINGNPLVRRSIKFKDRRVVLDDENKEHIPELERLRNAKGNKANGGNSFKELDRNENKAVSLNERGIFAAVPDDGITDADIQGLDYLSTLPVTFPPAAIKKTFGIAATVYERFQIAGINRPTEDLKPKRLKARVVEILGVLEDMGIWKYGDLEGEANIREGQAED